MLFINKLFNSIACLLSFTNLQLVIPGRTWILLYLDRTVYKRLWACLALYTDVCKLSHIEHERPVLFHELISGSSVSSSSVENNNEILESPVAGEGSDVDSMPELEDVTNSDTVEIPLWLIPNGVMVTFRRGRVIFEREQGPPWQDVLTQMLEEQNSILEDN